MNIGRIAIVNAVAEWAAKAAQSMYWSCHDSIRTQKLYWSQRTAKVVGTIIWNCRLVPTWPKNCGFLSGYQPRQDRARLIFGWVWNKTKPNRWLKTGPLAGFQDPLLIQFTVLRMTHHHYEATVIIRVLSPSSPWEISKLELNTSMFAITTVEICINNELSTTLTYTQMKVCNI